jgi:hypothetical protein
MRVRDLRTGFVLQTLPALNGLRARFDGRREEDGAKLSLSTALGIYVVLTELANEMRGDDFHASVAHIAKMAGSSAPTVRKYLAVYVEMELLIVERVTSHSGDEPSHYALVDLPSEGGKPVDPQVESEFLPKGGKPLSTVYKKEEDSSLRSEGESARGARPKVSGKEVNVEAWLLTGEVLAEFNQQAGKKLRLLSADGSPSEAAKRVYGRVMKYRDLELEDYADIIRRTLASRWWGDGEITPGVVFGPKVFEDNIARQGVSRLAKDAEKKERAQRDRAAIARVLARAKGDS